MAAGVTTLLVLGSGSWREAARARSSEIEVEHVAAALLAAGGAPAQLLGKHGVDLGAVRSAARKLDADDLATLGVDAARLPVHSRRPSRALQHEDVGEVPMSAAVAELFNDQSAAANDVGLLQGLLGDPRGRRIFALAGADVAAVRADLDSLDSPDWPAPRRVSPSRGLLPAGVVAAVAFEHFVAAAPEAIAAAVTDPAFVAAWLGESDDALQPDGSVVNDWKGLGSARLVRVEPVTSERQVAPDERRIAWQVRLSNRARDLVDAPTGYYDLQIWPVVGGSVVRLVRGIRYWGPLARLFRRSVTTAARLECWRVLQDLSSGIAERSTSPEPPEATG